MQLQFNTDVLEQNGGKLGALEHVVFNPETRQIVSLVVQPSAMEEGEVLVPVGAVDSADDMIVQLALDQDQFEDLSPFETYYNVAPPPNAEAIEEPGLPGVPEELPVGAATGIESIAYTPIFRENVNVSGQDVVIDGQTRAYATDGEVGRVKRVDANDETKRVEVLVVEHGLLFEHDLDVPIDLVSSIRQEGIDISVPKSRLRELMDV